MNERNDQIEISLRHVTKVYRAAGKAVTALEDASFDIKKGEFLVLAGPSGSGKSTLISILGGFLTPSSGVALCRDQTISGPSAERVVLFQQGGLFPWASVRANMEYGLVNNKLSRADRTQMADAMLNELGLTAFADAKPRELSGGMQKLLELGRALVIRPRVLLLDEPLGSLDVLTRRTVQALLQRLWMQHSTTVVMVTHDPEEALFLGDRIIVLSARPGKVESTIEVPLPRPRSDLDRASVAFQSLRQTLLGLLAPATSLPQLEIAGVTT